MLVTVLVTLGSIMASSLPLTHYAASSRLSKGRWRKVEVTQTGMQLLPNAQLRSMGFTNPAKVNVYGYGGRRLSQVMHTQDYIDDLPMQPVVRTDEGIVFFGVNTVTWTTDGGNRSVPYRASQNPYSTSSYYFISDVEPEEEYQMKELTWSPDSTIERHTTTFMERLLHEKDLWAPHNSGEWFLGEDFSQRTSQEFKFKLPDMAFNTAAVMTGFGTFTVDDTKYTLTANGEALTESNSQTIPGMYNIEDFIRYLTSTAVIPNTGEDLTLGITYHPAGTVYSAHLGFIIVAYERHLKLNGAPLMFYRTSSYNVPCVYEISGADSQTQIWDVTNPEAPVRIQFQLQDDKALFSPATTEYREFIAFDPSKVTLSPKIVQTSVSNQDIHAIETPDMVIISPREYLEQARRIADMHDRVDGMDVFIVTPEALYNEFSSGSPDVSAYRKALKMWYDRAPDKLKYCLLLGRPTYDQRLITDKVKAAGYPRPLIWQSPGEDAQNSTQTNYHTNQNSYSTDDYIGMLEDNKARIFDINRNVISIAVGRMPFRGIAHATQMTDKLIKYVENPELGPWRNRVTMVADNGDALIHFKQTMDSYTRLQNNGGDRNQYELILMSGETPTATSKGSEFPISKQRMLNMFDQGTSLVWYIGHANPREWTHDNLFNYTDVMAMDNRYLPIFYTATCEYSRWDADEVSAGEIMWSHPEAGAIALITTSRSVYITNNGIFTDNLSSLFYNKDKQGNPLTIGEAMRLTKNKHYDGNNQRYLLLGDPALKIVNPRLEVKVESIGDVDPSTLSDPDFPVFKGGSRFKISGTVMRGSSVARDFDGFMHITLYDAEQVLTTKDESAATQLDYNMRTNKVYEGRTMVTGGHWETEILLSTDIENNFSPARLTLYAYSDTGHEANGSFSKLYLYGIDESNNDKEGPEITGMGLNSYNYKPGSHVSSDAIFYASFSDPSGINLASAGVGHEMMISIDGKDYYTNVRDYYEPDATDIHAGRIAYPLSNLEPGRHTLEFSVCDNLGNFSTKTLEFAVSAAPKPTLYEVTPDCNPARTSVTFTIAHDRMREATECEFAVYNLSGRKIWSSTTSGRADIKTGTTVKWDLNDASGLRVPRGIYLYRATVQTADGISVSKTGKLAVTER